MKDRTETAAELIDGRVGVYGDPVKTFPQIAQVWSGIIGHEVKGTDVPLMLAGMKLVRAAQAPDYSDNIDDVEGYADIFRKVVGEDMIHARSVTEYLSLRGVRERHPEEFRKRFQRERLNLSETAAEADARRCQGDPELPGLEYDGTRIGL